MAFHPQGDGQTERMNRTILQKLTKVVGLTCDDWDEILLLTLLGYNTEKHTSTKVPPFRTMFHRDLNLPSKSPLTFVERQR